jgi:phage terminase large subunit
MPIAFQRGKQPGHFVLGQVLADPIGRVRLASSCCDWSHFSAFHQLEATVSDSTAIWFMQCVGRERRLVDYYEASGVGLDHYAQVLQDKRIQHGWKYGDH